jgi:hypothetical protein
VQLMAAMMNAARPDETGPPLAVSAQIRVEDSPWAQNVRVQNGCWTDCPDFRPPNGPAANSASWRAKCCTLDTTIGESQWKQSLSREHNEHSC